MNRAFFSLKLILATLLTLLVFSCTKEPDTYIITPQEAKGGEPLEVTMRLNTPGSFSSKTTRSGLTEQQENAVNNIYVFAFKADHLSYVRAADEIVDDDTDKSFKVTLKSSSNASDTYKLMVLANAEEWIIPILGSDLKALDGKSYSQVQQALRRIDITSTLFSSGKAIAMWGELSYQEINSTNKNFSVSLLRSISRIDVGVGATSYNPTTGLAVWEGLPSFTLEEVYVYKANNGILFVPYTSSYDATNKKVAQPSPIGTQQPSPFIYPVAGGISLVRKIYVPEANVKIETSGTSGDANHTNRMALVVKGSYKGNASSYYRLDFISSEKKLTNVLRNHLYQFNIKSVSGNGFSTPEEAYKSLSVNMNVEVIEWNDGDMNDVVFDGQYFLSVSKGEFTLPRSRRAAGDTDNKLTITTDVPTGWTIEKIEGLDGNPESATWLTVSQYTGNANEKTTISLLTDTNETGADRIAYLHITAGRLSYKVKVIQTTKDEIGLLLTNSQEVEVSELLFYSHVGATVPEQQLNVSWQPKAANPVISKLSVPDAVDFDFGSGDEVTVGQLVDHYGTVSYMIQPPAMTQAEVDANPFLEKASRFDFTVSNGNTNMSKTIHIRQRNYAAVPTVSPTYAMNGLDQYFTLKANAPWRIEIADDPDNAIDELITTAGGFNRDKSDERVYFKPVVGNGKATSTVKLKVISTNPGYPFADFEVTLTLRANQAAFSMVCSATEVKGVYKAGTPLGVTNTILVTVNAAALGSYEIATNEVDGISFSASGEFTSTGIQTVTLRGIGVPANTNVKTMTITSSSIGGVGTTCSVDVPIVIPVKRLLTIGTEPDASGFNFSGSAASNKLITAARNFGTLEESVVKANGFSIINGGYIPSDAQMQYWLVTDPVDIVVIGYGNINLSTTTAGYYKTFLKNGGVVLAFQDNTVAGVSENFLKAVLENDNIKLDYAGSAGAVYQFLNSDVDVLKGPFGDIRNMQWGEDRSHTVRISGIDLSTIDVLSTDVDISDLSPSGTGNVTAFKHKTLNLIWVGDGGFNADASVDQISSTGFPFKLDANNYPIAKNNYGRSAKYQVYNAVFTANAFAWALKQAEAKQE